MYIHIYINKYIQMTPLIPNVYYTQCVKRKYDINRAIILTDEHI